MRAQDGQTRPKRASPPRLAFLKRSESKLSERSERKMPPTLPPHREQSKKEKEVEKGRRVAAGLLQSASSPLGGECACCYGDFSLRGLWLLPGSPLWLRRFSTLMGLNFAPFFFFFCCWSTSGSLWKSDEDGKMT